MNNALGLKRGEVEEEMNQTKEDEGRTERRW